MSMHVYGIHPVEEVLDRAADRVEQIVVAGDLSESQFSTIHNRAQRAGISVRQTSQNELDRLADGGNHQRVAAEVSSYPYLTLDEAIEIGEDGDGFGCILALAQVQDPHNLGAILRSAAALGVDAAIIPKHRSAGITPAVVRASAGMAFEVPVAKVTNLARAIRTLKDQYWWVVGTVADEAQPMWQLDWEMNACVVMGGEHKGIRPGVEKECDFRVNIPMGRNVESLNVSTACAVTLYDRLRTLKA